MSLRCRSFTPYHVDVLWLPQAKHADHIRDVITVPHGEVVSDKSNNRVRAVFGCLLEFIKSIFESWAWETEREGPTLEERLITHFCKPEVWACGLYKKKCVSEGKVFRCTSGVRCRTKNMLVRTANYKLT